MDDDSKNNERAKSAIALLAVAVCVSLFTFWAMSQIGDMPL